MRTKLYPPELLYHYQSINSAELMGRLRHTLVSHQIYFSSPATLNDPFDCRLSPSFDGSLEQKRKYIAALAQTKYGANSEDARQCVELVLADSEYFEKTYSHFQRDEISRVGIYCLSECPDNTLMWSHYASSHTGVCLMFVANCMFPECALQRMNYTDGDQYPDINFFTSNGEEWTDAIFFTKARTWEYEQEWRLVDSSGFGLRDIQPEWLVGLILGCQIPQDQVEEIHRIALERKPILKLFRACQKQQDFLLLIEPLY